MADESKKDPYILRDIFQRMELDLISSLKRTFYKHKEDELKEGFQWEQWQLLKLRNLVKYRKANKDIIGEYSVPIENAIQEVLQESFIEGENNVIKAANEVGIILPDEKDMLEIKEPEQGIESIGEIINKQIELPKAPPDENFFRVNEKKLKALQDSVKNDFKEAQRSILRQMDDVYRQTIFKSHMYLQSGAASLNKAIDMATSDFLDKGINCIEYKNGNRVNISSYAEMALRTASQRATFLGEGNKRDELGIHTVVISAHANTCKLCAPWQGKVLIDDVFSHGTKSDGQYPLLSEAMEAGLFHPNCRHTMTTYFPGITKLPEMTDQDKAVKTYKAEQEQRYIERQIRRWKRREAGSTDLENAERAGNKVKEWQSRLKNHLGINQELRRDYERETPGPGITDKDVKTHVKLLKEQAENAKIEEIKQYIKSDKQPLTIEEGKQGKHIKGHNNYTEGRSYLTIDQEEAQELVNKYAGTGRIEISKEGKWKNKEVILCDKVIGVNVDPVTLEKTETKSFKIHYSKNGAHIVPRKEE